MENLIRHDYRMNKFPLPSQKLSFKFLYHIGKEIIVFELSNIKSPLLNFHLYRLHMVCVTFKDQCLYRNNTATYSGIVKPTQVYCYYKLNVKPVCKHILKHAFLIL